MTRYYHNFLHISRLASASINQIKIFYLAFITMMVLLITSCEEKPTIIGEGLLPGSDFVSIKAIDTINVFSYTMYDKSVRTDHPSLSYLGEIFDPYFGTTSAGFVTQLRMSQAWDGQPFILDSVRLKLTILDVKGGSDTPHSLRLSEIDKQIYTDSSYYSNSPIPLKVSPEYEIPDIVLPTLQPDTVNTISVNLDTLFGKYIFRDTTQLFYSNTKPDFRAYFKGLYFQMLPSADPMLISLSLVPSTSSGIYSSYIAVYLHDKAGVEKEYLLLLDAVNANASFNTFSHDFSTATSGINIETIINKVSKPSASDTLSYLQYLEGVYTKISLPGLADVKNDPSLKGIAVNKARLTVPIYFDSRLYKASTVPAQLILRYVNTSGTKVYVPDYTISSAFMGGLIDSTANVYTFNVPEFVQMYLDDSTKTIKPELEIFQGTGTRNVILKANGSKTPVKFEFTYTKF